ncbi:DUF5615 family PIN-like protein [Candidatus Aerophobetes bacterium]|nr:DUF5615 family PIN-like protein [Candidatus Aerophobetes bacterium]
MLRILADENIHSEIITYLEDRGYDVLSIAQENSLTGCSDEQLIQIAQKEERIIISADKDFGRLVELNARRQKLNLILLRYTFFDVGKIKTGLDKVIRDIESENLESESFIVVLDETKIRVRRY